MSDVARLASVERDHSRGFADVLADYRIKPGAYTSVWNGTDARSRRLANGVYFYALDDGSKRISRKVVLAE
ncbi:MAG: hypothetical protein NTX53_20925 [candidate division WOR-3 bacterium]|nr:hypothetical protein [candidate division WOR-3 bacterium]